MVELYTVFSYDSVLDQLARDFFNSSMKDWKSLNTKSTYPKVDIYDDNDSLTMVAAVPGLTKDDVKVHLEKDVLTISGQRKDSEKKNFLRQELRKTNFSRSWIIPETLDQSSIIAKVENGLLLITLKKKVEDKNKKINIEVL